MDIYTILFFISFFALAAVVATILRRPRGQRSWKAWTPTLRLAVVGVILMFLSSLDLLYVYVSFFILRPIGIELPYFYVEFVYKLPLFVLGLLLLSLSLSTLIADTAKRKGRSWAAFFWLSVLVSPVIMGIIVASLGQRSELDFPESGKPTKDERSLESRLMELQELKDKGLLSDNEFNEAKKKAIGL